MCDLKENGGLGFCCLEKLNLALLAKQGWRLIKYSNSLLARTLKAKYFRDGFFFKILDWETHLHILKRVCGLLMVLKRTNFFSLFIG